MRKRENDMKRMIRFFGKWRVQLALFVLTVLLGFVGYCGYYNNTDTPGVLKRPLFSTIKLFGGVIDYNDSGVNMLLEKSGAASKAGGESGPKAELPAAADPAEQAAEKDAEPEKTGETNRHLLVYLAFLWIARYTALFVTVPAVINFLKELFPKFFAELYYKLWKRRRGKLLLVGGNEENIHFYETADSKWKPMLFSGNGKDIAPPQDRGLHCYRTDDGKAAGEISAILRKTFLSDTDTFTVIINTDDDETNLRLCRAAAESVIDAVGKDAARITERAAELEDREAQKTDPELMRLKRRVVEKLERVRIFVFGDKQYEQVYLELEDKSFGVLHYTNKYHLCSFDFLTKYPMTKYMTASQLPGDGCVAPDMAFNMIFVGFGDTNREIFLDSFATNQFVYHRENKIPDLKPVDYHIFDKKTKIAHDKNLNHTIFRYLDDFAPLFGDRDTDRGRNTEEPGGIHRKALNAKDYLELPPVPGRMFSHEMSIDSEEFYDRIRDICMQNPRSVNYLIVAFGNDFSNIDLAQRLETKKNEWGLSNLYLFVKVRSRENEKVAELLRNGDDRPYMLFGSEVFTLDEVIHNEIEVLAYNRKRVTLNTVSDEKPDEKKPGNDTVRVLYSWYTMSQRMRRSNIYNILALRMKLHLLGLDYTPDEGYGQFGKGLVDGLTQEDYFNLYAKGCKPVKTRDPGRYRGAMYSYDNNTVPDDYKSGLPRRNLVVQEHYRWNAYMIKCGFIPPTRAEIERGFVKDYKTRRMHANLCSFEALFAFRDIQKKLYLEKYGPDRKPEDVIGYDYKLMDEAWFFLNACGYEIIPKK